LPPPMSLDKPKKEIKIDRKAIAKDIEDIAKLLKIDLSEVEEEEKEEEEGEELNSSSRRVEKKRKSAENNHKNKKRSK
jgi:hypothetical protein